MYMLNQILSFLVLIQLYICVYFGDYLMTVIYATRLSAAHQSYHCPILSSQHRAQHGLMPQ